MLKRKPKKPYTLWRFIGDVGTIAAVTVVGGVVWTTNKIVEVVSDVS